MADERRPGDGAARVETLEWGSDGNLYVATGEGSSVRVFGGDGTRPDEVQLDSIDGETGVVLQGAEATSESGSSVGDIRIAGRATRGVRLFDVAEGERVVSVTRLEDDEENGENGGNGENGDPEKGLDKSAASEEPMGAAEAADA